MRGYSIMSEEERQSILSQHQTLYNGYAVKNVTSNMTPLTVGDYALDKGGITVNNNGEVSQYKNHKINESKELDEIGLDDLESGKKYKYKNPRKSLGGDEKIVKYVDKVDYEDGEPHFQFSGEDEDFSALFGADDVETDIDIYEDIADDMDLSNVDSAYDFESGGPEEFEMSSDDMDPYDSDLEMIQNMFDFEDMYGSDNDSESMIGITDMMDNEFDGKEKMKGEKSAFNFKSKGADDSVFGEEDMFMESDDSVCEQCGEYDEIDEIDEDLVESFKKQKEKITEMFNRFKNYN